MCTRLCQPLTSKTMKLLPWTLLPVSNPPSAAKPSTPATSSEAPARTQYHCANVRRIGASTVWAMPPDCPHPTRPNLDTLLSRFGIIPRMRDRDASGPHGRSPSERDFLAAVRDHVVVFDGGMGATLEQFDLSLEADYRLPGRCHEALVLNRPDVIQGVHESMLDAGAEVVETDTFQASRLKLEEWGLGEHTLEINTKAAQIAREAAGEQRFVAGSIGPTGHLPASDDPTLGKIRFRELVAIFTQQAQGLIEGGADLLIIETAQDILEVKAAIFGAREAFDIPGKRLPIQTSVSLLPNGGKMLLGTDIQAVLTRLTALDVDVIGLNCSTGPEDMRDA